MFVEWRIVEVEVAVVVVVAVVVDMFDLRFKIHCCVNNLYTGEF